MNDVVKKRVVGAIVLVAIGILVPLLLVRCLNGGASDNQATRVYEITPEGQPTRAESETTSPADATPGTRPADTGSPDTAPPPAVSPENRAGSGGGGQAPPVAGNGGADTSSRAPSSSSAASPAGDSRSLRRDTSKNGGWIVQVASFSEEHGAEVSARRLNQDFDAFYRVGNVDGKTYYRVSVGPFDSESQARAAAAELRAQGESTLVRQAR